MPIELQCNACGKKIKAPDSAGGKWGKCPMCHARIYVPLPQANDDDELRLAPLDETEEQKQKQLMLETYRLTQDILQEREVSDTPGPGVGPSPEVSDEKLTGFIVRYLRQMANSELDDAQRTADLIVPHRRKAVTILDDFAKTYPPDPDLADVSQQLLLRFIRNLRTRIS
ncbi:MAG: hypothetical protein MUC88_26820 [Planctomycetes bacterium]|jgi:hypothetical protein|nr:hypothetical protein [Planctomycetota bacterium]